MKNTNGSRFLLEIRVTMYKRVLKCIISRSVYPPKEIIQAVAKDISRSTWMWLVFEVL